MAGVVWIPWYVTVFRKDMMAEEISAVAPIALRYGATQYAVYVSQDGTEADRCWLSDGLSLAKFEDAVVDAAIVST